MIKTETKMERHTGRDRQTDRAPRQSEKRKWSSRTPTPPPQLPVFRPRPWTPRLLGCYGQPLAPKRQKGPRGPLHVGALHSRHAAPGQPTGWHLLPRVGPAAGLPPASTRLPPTRLPPSLASFKSDTAQATPGPVSQGQAPNHKEERNYRRGWRQKSHQL